MVNRFIIFKNVCGYKAVSNTSLVATSNCEWSNLIEYMFNTEGEALDFVESLEKGTYMVQTIYIKE